MLKRIKKSLIKILITASAVAAPAMAFAQEKVCNFDGVVHYFTDLGVVKGTAAFLSVGVLLFFAFTKKNLPAIVKKIIDVVSGLLGNTPAKP